MTRANFGNESSVPSESTVTSLGTASLEAEVLAATTRAQSRRMGGGADTENTDPAVDLGHEFDDELFDGGRERAHLTKKQKRLERRRYVPEERTESISTLGTRWRALDMTPAEFRDAQVQDPTLATAWKVAEGTQDLAVGGGFYVEDGLLHRHWVPRGLTQEDPGIHQLVLPVNCRDSVMAAAHEIPLGGHLGKTKTTQRLLQRFY